MQKLFDKAAVDRLLRRLSFEIIETNKNMEDVVLVGLVTRGVNVATRIQSNIEKETGINVDLVPLQTKGYRDDHKKADEAEKINYDFKDKIVIICDDVFETGRTARAAIDAIIAHGRPKLVRLLAITDRGHRELPLRLDYIGKNIPTAKDEIVKVRFEEIDNATEIILEKRKK